MGHIFPATWPFHTLGTSETTFLSNKGKPDTVAHKMNLLNFSPAIFFLLGSDFAYLQWQYLAFTFTHIFLTQCYSFTLFCVKHS